MMKNFKKSTAIALCALLATSSAITFAGCKGDNIVVDGKTVNIRMGVGGNGVEWAYILADEFEKVYAEEGYKINILEPSVDIAGNVVLTDMALGAEETGIDLYISSGFNSIDVFGESGDYGVLAEDIREIVYNQPAIGYNGVEESVPISSKISEDLVKYSVDSHGKMYGFQYNETLGGLAVNTKKLAKYGLELPKTTNELWECVETIYLGTDTVANSEKSGIFPITYVSGSNGYVTTALNTWLAQYDFEEFQRFWSMQETASDGTKTDMTGNGYDVFNTKAVEEMLTLAFQYMDIRIATKGSTAQNLDQAQAKVMQENTGAVFMFNGSWMMNEVKLNYKKQVDDITFINMPVVSALGTRLMGSGTTYNLSNETCEEILSYIIGMVDANKTIAEMISSVQTQFSVTLSEEVVEEIAAARGYAYTRGVEQIAVMNKNAPAKVPAALFLRMMASDDFAQTWLETANSAPLYSKDVDMSGVTNEFVKAAVNISLNDYHKAITGPRMLSGYRKELGLNSTFTHKNHIPSAIYEQFGSGKNANSIFDGAGKKRTDVTLELYRTKAQAMQKTEYEFAQGKWAAWKENLMK